jgi:N-acetylmuramoyl-L-alanine amidase
MSVELIRDIINYEKLIGEGSGQTMVNGEEFGEYFGLESNRVYFIEDSVIFKAIGKGMGLGICLEGANNFAQMGTGYKDIINYYYTGITFEKLDEYVLLKTLRDKKIVIDPGHGGGDIGNVSLDLMEKNANLIIAKYLEKKLRDIGAEVLLTRNDDKNVPLGDRVEFINRERPGLYISIHQNDFMSPGVNGVECYCYSRDEDALRLGSIISKEISKKVGVKNRGVRVGDYYLLRECKLSGVIVECMYMTGNQDRGKYIDENYVKIAEAIFNSICEYFNIEPEISE